MTATALKELAQSGAHLVLAGRDKRPITKGWLRQPPSIKSILAHHRRRGLVGLVPWSVRCSIIDIDAGDPTHLLAAHTPLTGWPTRRPGGAHFVYRDVKGRRNARLDRYDCQGDIRGAKGFVILWGDAPTALLDVLVDPPAQPHLFPAEDLLLPPIPESVSAAATDNATTREIDLNKVWPSERNNALFDVVRFWAYAQSRGADIDQWYARVQAFALDANDAFPIPLSEDEVWTLSFSISTWTWEHRNYAGGRRYDHSSELQRLRAYKRAWSVWRKNLPRNLKIRELAQRGVPQREIGRRLGLSHSQVSRVLARWRNLAPGALSSPTLNRQTHRL